MESRGPGLHSRRHADDSSPQGANCSLRPSTAREATCRAHDLHGIRAVHTPVSPGDSGATSIACKGFSPQGDGNSQSRSMSTCSVVNCLGPPAHSERGSLPQKETAGTQQGTNRRWVPEQGSRSRRAKGQRPAGRRGDAPGLLPTQGLRKGKGCGRKRIPKTEKRSYVLIKCFKRCLLKAENVAVSHWEGRAVD